MNPLNNVIESGRVTTEPEGIANKEGVRFQSRFSIAVDRAYKTKEGEKITDFIPIRYNGEKRQDFIEKNIHKGTSLTVAGSLETDTYEKDGQKRTVFYVKAESISFPPHTKRDTENTNTPNDQTQAPAQAQTASTENAPAAPEFTSADDELDLPFA